MCNTSNALYALVLSKQMSFKQLSETVRSQQRFTQFVAQAVPKTGSRTRDRKKPDDHMWRDLLEGRVVDDDWQNADDVVRQCLR